MGKKFYITTPLYYVNAPPHIGHSYTNIVCDTLARFRRQQGYTVFFLTGTDEHGQKVKLAAEQAGFKPQEFTDKIVPHFKTLWRKLNVSYDDFIRTTESRHIKAVHKVLSVLYNQGDLYLGKYEGWYCTPCETFWTDRALSQASQGEVSSDKLCPDCQRPLERIQENNYFFKLSRYQKWLIEHIQTHSDFILPNFRANEILNLLNEPLSDLCISRPRARLDWGIDVPFSKDHVTYVWFDALINYISACGYASNEEKFKKFWPADIHMIGKDILRHHAIYWPIILKAVGLKPPRTIFAHGWWKVEETKISKSRGNIVDPTEVIAQFGVDGLRYFLLREVPLGADGSYSEQALAVRFNSDLANDLGNLVYRSLTMVEKYFQGQIPDSGITESSDKPLINKAEGICSDLNGTMEKYEFSQALTSIWALINLANKYIEDSAPWSLFKDNPTRLATVIYNLVEVLRITTLAVYPFIPQTAEQIWQQMGMDESLGEVSFEALGHWGLTKSGIKINKGKPLFPRLEI